MENHSEAESESLTRPPFLQHPIDVAWLVFYTVLVVVLVAVYGTPSNYFVFGFAVVLFALSFVRFSHIAWIIDRLFL